MPAERIPRYSQLFSDDFSDGAVFRSRSSDMIATIPASSSDSSISSSSSDSPPPKVDYIEHRVSKMDTLPGVAIKYGVEVEDIKRMNGLMTDIQMFAHKSLQIPLPGRHPPSNSLSNGSVDNGNYSRDHNPPHRPSNDVLDLLHSLKLNTPPSKVSPAMNNLQSHYGLTQQNGPDVEGTEMSVYRIDGSCVDDELWSTELPFPDSVLGMYKKPINLVNGFSSSSGETAKEKVILDTAENSEMELSVRRRSKNDAGPSLGTNELLKEDNGSGFSGRRGKSLTMKPKLGSQSNLDMACQNDIPNGGSFINVGSVFVRKSSSTPSLQESQTQSSYFKLPTGLWTLNAEVLIRPLFDVLPKPKSARKKN
ncbi:hypothetical protein Cni_G18561 [Canna indica]|uniref:LysM domain-containing protein n=1 Tax=Canna indica TaxID=4628 RepID=A0AAQ3QHS9_9LILI|nr:hypothetical protein Cni_G18561 [Canna indica]